MNSDGTNDCGCNSVGGVSVDVGAALPQTVDVVNPPVRSSSEVTDLNAYRTSRAQFLRRHVAKHVALIVAALVLIYFIATVDVEA